MTQIVRGVKKAYPGLKYVYPNPTRFFGFRQTQSRPEQLGSRIFTTGCR